MKTAKSIIFALASTWSLNVAFAAENFVTGQILMSGAAVQVSGDELRSIIRQGVQVETYAPRTSSYRLWTNDASGKFIASRRGGTANARSEGLGEWKLTESGEYCVQIDWRFVNNQPDYTEKWCRVLWRYDGALYIAPSDLTGKADTQYSVIRFR